MVNKDVYIYTAVDGNRPAAWARPNREVWVTAPCPRLVQPQVVIPIINTVWR